MLHPAVWSGPQVRVFSSNAGLLGLPLAMEQQYVYSNFNFTGSAIGLPICFLLNSMSQLGYLNTTGQSWPQDQNNDAVIELGDPDGKPVGINDTIPFEHCHGKGHVQEGAVRWHRCRQKNVVQYLLSEGFNETMLNFLRLSGNDTVFFCWPMEN